MFGRRRGSSSSQLKSKRSNFLRLIIKPRLQKMIYKRKSFLNFKLFKKSKISPRKKRRLLKFLS
jgi:hypothetical protein